MLLCTVRFNDFLFKAEGSLGNRRIQSLGRGIAAGAGSAGEGGGGQLERFAMSRQPAF